MRESIPLAIAALTVPITLNAGVMLSETFLPGDRAKDGDAVAGVEIGIGGRVWKSEAGNAGLYFQISDGEEVAACAGDLRRCRDIYVPFSVREVPPERRRLILSGDVRPESAAGNGWVALAFAGNSMRIFDSFPSRRGGQIWMMVDQDGSWGVFAKGTTYVLAEGKAGSAPGFTANQVNWYRLELVYDVDSRVVKKAKINDVEVLSDIHLDQLDPPFEPRVEMVGFDSFAPGSPAEQNQTHRVDNFLLQTSRAE